MTTSSPRPEQPSTPRRIAIVGSGVSGLVAAHVLGPHHDVTVFEAAPRPGGHAHTVRAGDHDIDTGFVVFNEHNYPGLVALFRALDIKTQPSDMSFGVHCAPRPHGASSPYGPAGLQYRGSSNPWWLFAQRRNLIRPDFYRFVRAIGRFNRAAKQDTIADETKTLGAFVEDLGLPRSLLDHYLVPMAAAVWSAEPAAVARIPARFFVDFFRNHGFFDLRGRPKWRTVVGGSSTYVKAIAQSLGDRLRLNTPVSGIGRSADGVSLRCGDRSFAFDDVILALRGDHALRLLDEPSAAESQLLGCIQFQPNDVVLHTDASMMPPNRRAWASWNYYVPSDQGEHATVTYHCNRLQRLPGRTQYFITLNRTQDIDPALVLRQFDYAHPVFTVASRAAQRQVDDINGVRRTWYCGAYWGNGFHEDGVESARRVTRAFGQDL